MGALGPAFWNIVFDEHLDMEDKDTGVYADNLTHIIKGNDKEQAEVRTQGSMEVTYRLGKDHKIKISSTETSWEESVQAKSLGNERRPSAALTIVRRSTQIERCAKTIDIWHQ